MNIAFFLIPKKDVVYLNINATVRQAMEKLEYHSYTAIPLIDNDGKYAGTLTEGDLLWKIKSLGEFDFNMLEQIRLSSLKLRFKNQAVRADAEMETLLSLVVSQNFVPVLDDYGRFIGIIRRREIIDFYVRRNFLHNGGGKKVENGLRQ